MKIKLYIKDPDVACNIADTFELSEKQSDKYFEFGEYFTLELEVDKDMKVIGRIVPRGKAAK